MTSLEAFLSNFADPKTPFFTYAVVLPVRPVNQLLIVESVEFPCKSDYVDLTLILTQNTDRGSYKSSPK